MNKITIAVVMTTMLCSCGFMTPAKQYEGDQLGTADIAVIKSHLGKTFSEEYHATITGYAKIDSNGPEKYKVFGLPGFTDYPDEIHVLAGKYEVQVYCFNGLTSYRPKKALALQAGKTYILQCEVRNGQALIQVNAKS
ncbi:MAG: hypothetical protein WCL27_16705, partial [Betaproteobacteria bacterium]